MDNIIVNPLLNLITINKPSWLCKHIDAIVVNYEKKYYRCEKCAHNSNCKTNAIIVSMNKSDFTDIIRKELSYLSTIPIN